MMISLQWQVIPPAMLTQLCVSEFDFVIHFGYGLTWYLWAAFDDWDIVPRGDLDAGGWTVL